MKYATGKNALGICDRCGLQAPLKMLVPDLYKPGLLVHKTCRDEKHPQDKPVNTEEGIVLKNPRPDRDVEAGGNGVKVKDALFPGQDVFGGGT